MNDAKLFAAHALQGLLSGQIFLSMDRIIEEAIATGKEMDVRWNKKFPDSPDAIDLYLKADSLLLQSKQLLLNLQSVYWKLFKEEISADDFTNEIIAIVDRATRLINEINGR